MPATSPDSEAFGWPSFYEDPNAHWRAQQGAYLAHLEAGIEDRARQAALTAVRILRERGLLREDRLSYTRICELEHETGIFTGSWTDYLNALHEAELQDREHFQ